MQVDSGVEKIFRMYCEARFGLDGADSPAERIACFGWYIAGTLNGTPH